MTERTFIVCGMVLGDEGKGTIVDFLARKFGIKNIFRFNGGPQAEHNVVNECGIHHGCSQFSSGALIPGVKTFLASPTVFSPLSLMLEAEELARKGYSDALDYWHVDEDCYLVTPIHVLINHLRELVRGDNRHGSCGKGVGEAVYSAEKFPSLMPQAKDLRNRLTLFSKLDFLREVKTRFVEEIMADQALSVRGEIRSLGKQFATLDLNQLADDYMAIAARIKIIPHEAMLEIIAKGGVIFEGAQGALLDQDYGFNPYTTWSRTGFANAMDLIGQSGNKERPYRLAVARAYFTRHGAGPFVTEDPELKARISSCHNVTNDWQGDFRLGWFDIVAARYALKIMGGADGLAMTNLDRFDPSLGGMICTAYRLPESATEEQMRLFMHLDDEAAEIRLHKSQDDLLARTLNQCQPIYSELPNVSAELPASDRLFQYSLFYPYQQLVANMLKVPLVVTSYSPDAQGKYSII